MSSANDFLKCQYLKFSKGMENTRRTEIIAKKPNRVVAGDLDVRLRCFFSTFRVAI